MPKPRCSTECAEEFKLMEGEAARLVLAARKRTDFRWLIEAPGPRYLAIQRLSMSDNFEWTTDHDKALAFRSEGQADALMMAVRQMSRQIHGFDKGLFGFEATIGNAKATEHGWLNVTGAAAVTETYQDDPEKADHHPADTGPINGG